MLKQFAAGAVVTVMIASGATAEQDVLALRCEGLSSVPDLWPFKEPYVFSVVIDQGKRLVLDIGSGNASKRWNIQRP